MYHFLAMKNKTNELEKIIDSIVAMYGSQRALAQKCGVKQQTISKWRNGDAPINAKRAKQLSKLSGWKIHPSKLSDDFRDIPI